MHMKNTTEAKRIAHFLSETLTRLNRHKQVNEYVAVVHQDEDDTYTTYNARAIAENLGHQSREVFWSGWNEIDRACLTHDEKLERLNRFFENDVYNARLLGRVRGIETLQCVKMTDLESPLIDMQYRYCHVEHLYLVVTRYGDKPFPDSSSCVINVGRALTSYMEGGRVTGIVLM